MPFLPYARLMRLPNVFTALSDIAVGICAAIGLGEAAHDASWWGRSGALLLASACLYIAGMVWNDYFDLEEDRRDRPFRPLASGRISLRTARLLGGLLIFTGICLAALSGLTPSRWRPDAFVIASLLAAAVLAYDARIKRTSSGPVGMAFCRFLNILLGLTLADTAAISWPMRLHIAAVVGLYIVGVTWFARTEEKRSTPTALKGAAGVMFAALLLALAVPIRVPPGTSSFLFPYLLVLFGFAIGLPMARAIARPLPDRVQAAVKRCILGLIALDALLATVFIGTAGLLVLLLLPPALVLGKWVYST